jgi:hypothetical protein
MDTTPTTPRRIIICANDNDIVPPIGSPRKGARRRIITPPSVSTLTLPRTFAYEEALLERIIADRVKDATAQLRAEAKIILSQLSVQANTITLMREHMEALRNECLHFRERAVVDNATKEALYNHCQDAVYDLNEMHMHFCERADIICGAMCAKAPESDDLFMRFSGCSHYIHQKCIRAPHVATTTGFKCPLCNTVSPTLGVEKLSRAFYFESADDFSIAEYLNDSRTFVTGDTSVLPSTAMVNMPAFQGDPCAAIVESLPVLHPLFKSICTGEEAAYQTLATPEYVASLHRMKRTFDQV